jgi:hypothetical protein
MTREPCRETLAGILVGNPSGTGIAGILIALIIQFATGTWDVHLLGNPQPTPLWVLGMFIGIALWFVLMTIVHFAYQFLY